MKPLLDQLTAKNIIFDLDGTLIDSAPGILESFRIACEKCSVKPVVPLHASLIGPPLMKTLVKVSGSSRSEVLLPLAAAFKEHYDNHGYKKTKYFNGVPELLGTLKDRGHVMYIATNKRKIPTDKIVDLLRWRDFFEMVYSLDSYQPHLLTKSELLAAVVANRLLALRDVAYVGDREEDGVAASDNGIDFVRVSWGYNDSQIIEELRSNVSMLSTLPVRVD